MPTRPTLTQGIASLDATAHRGDGRTPASDGQRFALPRKVLQQTYSTTFSDFALEFYTFVADNYAPFYSRPIECTDRDAAFVLDGLLYNGQNVTEARGPEHVLLRCYRLRSVTSTPHDALFKSVFEQPEHAAAELQHILPEPIAAEIRWSTLALEPGSFVAPELAGLHSDLLFSAEAEPSGEPILVFLLCEHQSSPEPTMPLRMLEYMVRVWTRYSRAHPGEPLPLIIPALLAQVPGGWTSPTRFSAMFSPHRGAFGNTALPDFEYTVDDLAHVSDDDLHRRALDALPKVALWLMRDARDATALLRSLEQWLPLLDGIVRAPTGKDAAVRLLSYIARVSDDLHFEQFRDRLTELAPATEKLAVTIAEQLEAKGRAKGKAEGRVEGKAEGRVEGKAEAVLRVLEARSLHVSNQARHRIETCDDIGQLDLWLTLAATSARVEDLF